MTKTLASIAGAIALALSQGALAQNLGFYAGGSLGQAKAKDWCSDSTGLLTCDDKDMAWKIFGGYQFHPNLAVELQYMDMGKVSATADIPPFGPVAVSADNRQFAASLVGIMPLGASQFSLFGKVGIESIDQRSTFTGGGGVDFGRGSDSGLLLGAGLKWAIDRNLRLRGEWEHGDTLNADTFSIGLEYWFGR